MYMMIDWVNSYHVWYNDWLGQYVLCMIRWLVGPIAIMYDTMIGRPIAIMYDTMIVCANIYNVWHDDWLDQ
jgi:hypothetical protein